MPHEVVDLQCRMLGRCWDVVASLCRSRFDKLLPELLPELLLELLLELTTYLTNAFQQLLTTKAAYICNICSCKPFR